MSNVIRANFGAKADAPPQREEPAVEHHPVRVFGQAAGYAVALLQDDAAPEGPVLKIVVGLLSGNTVETVAILPATPEGATDADVTGMAILRTLEVVEDAARPPSGA